MKNCIARLKKANVFIRTKVVFAVSVRFIKNIICKITTIVCITVELCKQINGLTTVIIGVKPI